MEKFVFRVRRGLKAGVKKLQREQKQGHSNPVSQEQPHQDPRTRLVNEAIRFLEDKPEIYGNESLAWQLIENAKRRNAFMQEVGALTSHEVATVLHSGARNRAAYASKLKSQKLIFSVEFRGEQRYPAFQFDPETGKPKPVIETILSMIGEEWSGWELAFWFVTPNGYLDDRTPIDVLDENPEAIISAMHEEVAELEF